MTVSSNTCSAWQLPAILLIMALHDVPGRDLDGLTMDDASEVRVFEYIMCCICR